jgi:hypothetical protein
MSTTILRGIKMKRQKQAAKIETRQRALRNPIDLDDWLATKKFSPNESFTSVVTRLLYAVKASEEKTKK